MKRKAEAQSKFFKNKKQMVLYIFLFILFMAGFIYFGSKEYVEPVLDNEIFTNEHEGANTNNVFKYINVKEAYDLIRKDDAILFIGLANNENVTYYANIVDDVAKEFKIESISYYDIESDRSTKNGESKNGTYEKIVDYFGDYVTYLDDGTANLYAPTLIVKKDGVILLFDDDDAFREGRITNKEYWAKKTSEKKFTIQRAFADYVGEELEEDGRA